jgi:uncharacterized protein YgiM (DUF1202 family)
MNKFVQISAIVTTMSLNVWAHDATDNKKYAYITDNIYKPVRSTPDAQNRDNILIHLASNIKVVVVENMGQWSKILYANNRVGFIPSRYLLSGSTSRIRLKKVKTAYEKLHKENIRLKKIIASTKTILVEQNILLSEGFSYEK